MPIIQSAKKQLRQSRKKNIRNVATVNMMKNHIKDFEKTLEEDANEAAKKWSKVQKLIDTAAKKRVISVNRASRLVSRLMVKMNQGRK